MLKQEFIYIDTLSSHYEIEISFFHDLDKTGLIEIHIVNEKPCIHQDRISDLEKMLRLHQELKLNFEGIDVVFNLLNKISGLQEELAAVKNRLRLYEND